MRKSYWIGGGVAVFLLLFAAGYPSMNQALSAPDTTPSVAATSAAPTPKPAAVGTRTNPVRLGNEVNPSGLLSAAVVTAEDVTQTLTTPDQYGIRANDAPVNGHYVMVQVKYTYTGKKTFNAMASLMPTFVTTAGNSFRETIVTGPSSWLDDFSAGDVFPGASETITYVFDVPSTSGLLRLQDVGDSYGVFMAV